MKVHLLDGTFELFRAYYAVPPYKNAKGQEVGAVRGLLRSLVALLRAPSVTHVACAFDHVIESFRNDLFAGYKTGEGIEPDLKAQFPLAEKGVRALGIPVWPMIQYEADDALATAAAKWSKLPSVEQIIICSPDKDLAQMVQGRRVVCWDRIRNKILDETGVKKKFGVLPSSIPDWLALVGDSSDGIPGVPRWGAKSASTVLSVYRHVEKIPDDCATWKVKVRGAAALADNLRSHRESADLYRILATLKTDVPLKERLQDLKWRGALSDDLRRVSRFLADEDLLDRVPKWQ